MMLYQYMAMGVKPNPPHAEKTRIRLMSSWENLTAGYRVSSEPVVHVCVYGQWQGEKERSSCVCVCMYE